MFGLLQIAVQGMRNVANRTDSLCLQKKYINDDRFN